VQGLKKLKRTFAQFLLFNIAVFLISMYLPGFYMKDVFSAVAFTLVVSSFNFLLWPVLLRWMQGFLVATFGIGSFLLSTFIMWLTTLFIPGVTISPWTLFTAPVTVALVSAVITLVLNIEDDDVYARQVHSLLRRRMEKAEKNSKSGFVFLEIDGLSEEVLKTAIERGKMPTLAGWLRSGTHKITGWETDLSSQTASSQAGILHGYNSDIPAFRWVDKYEGNKIVSSNGINDAPLIQKRISDGKGLLSVNGGSIANLFSGDSKDNVLVYSTLKNIRHLYSESWTAFYSRPFNTAQVLVLFLGELFFEARSRYRQWRKNIQPRLKHRGLAYYIARAGANVLLREVSTYTVIGNIIAGEKDVVYTTFFGYDEVAHHCGVLDEECFNVLKGIDKRISRIIAAGHHSSRSYHICILSDHGQTNGATFKQRYGVTLDEYVRRFLPKDESVYQELDSNQDHFFQMMTAPCQGIKCKLTRGAEAKKLEKAGVIVLASGNLGLIYFTRYTRRLTWEEIDAVYPGLVDGLAGHEGIGFVLLRSKSQGPVVLNAKGRYYLADNTVEGKNPLAKFGKNAATHLRRTDSFNYVPDILVMSLYDSERDEVASFEELIGSHGGLGGNQSKPFIMYPSKWNLPEREMVGSEKIYQFFKSVMVNEKTGGN
jgi:putative membrane protein